MAVTPAIWFIFDEDLEEEEDEDESEEVLDFVSELPHAAKPRHMIVVQAAATALKRVDLRIGSTLASIIDFHSFFRLLQRGNVE
ncbi:hypothetical protein CE153_02830 [Bifidobacterium sp. N4G05]|nr:hypothetical protein CE153_02830 [Bifidobacterium sp. N4G05]